MIIMICIFEIQVRMQYGSGKIDFFVKIMYYFFPATFTVGENMKLTRQLFPLLF
jgi:hypothetical protein